jgi:acyl carrier protein
MSKEEKIKHIIQEVLGVNIIEVTNSAHLIYDLGASDTQLAEIVNKIEESFSIVLGFESFDMTVEDLLIVVFSEIEEDSQRLSSKPRPLHYSFAHQVLPALAFNEGLHLFSELRYKKGQDYLQGYSGLVDQETENRPVKQGIEYLLSLWSNLSSDLKKNEIDPKGLDYEMVEKSNNLILLFHFPQPEAAGEAFYSLFAWKKDVSPKEAARYFTLELTKDNKSTIGQWTEDGQHINHGSYSLLFTPRQFLDEVLKKLLPRENTSTIDVNNDQSDNAQFLVDGLFEKEHIYLKIIDAIAHKLSMPASLINRNTSVQELVKQDFIDIITEVYQKYGIDSSKHMFFIKQDVDRLMKIKADQGLNCRVMVIRICQHFENRIAGDYDNPKDLYLDYRAKIDLISQSPDYALLYNFISQTYPSFITDNADQKKIESRSLLFQEMLSIPEMHLAHNYPIDPRGLFICLVAVAIAHAEYTFSEEKVSKYLDAATALNTKWGPFIKPVLLEKIANRVAERKVKFHHLRKLMDSKLIRPFYRVYHELVKK